MSYRILKQIGLSAKEAEVYETLLKLGESPVADIIEATSDHPQIIYRALDGLNAFGLITVSFRRHRKYVRAEDPHVLEKIEESRLRELRGAIPHLAALQKSSKDAIVRINKGNEAVRNLRFQAYDTLKADETYYIIGASGDYYYTTMSDAYVESERRRVKKQIQKRLVTFESQREIIENNEAPNLLKFAEYRYLAETYPAPTSTNFYSNIVATIIWIPSPIVITIESPEVAESYRHYFESLWKIAKR